MSTPADLPNKGKQSYQRSPIGAILSLPPQWLRAYEDFITKNASQVSQLESALRSLTYVIPGTFGEEGIPPFRTGFRVMHRWQG